MSKALFLCLSRGGAVVVSALVTLFVQTERSGFKEIRIEKTSRVRLRIYLPFTFGRFDKTG